MIAWDCTLACVNIYIPNEDRQMTVTVLMRGLARAIEDTRIQLEIIGVPTIKEVEATMPNFNIIVRGTSSTNLPTGTITIEADTDRSISQTFQYSESIRVTSADLVQALNTVGDNKYWIVYSGDSVYAPAVGYGTITVTSAGEPDPTPSDPTPTPTPDDPVPTPEPTPAPTPES